MKATPEIVAQQRAQLAGAREHRAVTKDKAEATRAEVCADADTRFAKAIAKARDLNVPWNDIVAATGINRQHLAGLVREHVNGKH